jgi:hypothetical protein
LQMLLALLGLLHRVKIVKNQEMKSGYLRVGPCYMIVTNKFRVDQLSKN